jgi:GAF domain-containing protein/anti-sigma regulatory factor (Ser/Thr protein kinase)
MTIDETPDLARPTASSRRGSSDATPLGSGAPAHEVAAFTRWLLEPDPASPNKVPDDASLPQPREVAYAERMRARDLRFTRWQRILVREADAGFRNIRRIMQQEGMLLAERHFEATTSRPDRAPLGHGNDPLAGACARTVQRLSSIAAASAPFAPEVHAVRGASPILLEALVLGYQSIAWSAADVVGATNPLASRVAELAALQRINAVINSSLDLGHVLNQTIAVVREVTHVDTANVYLLEDGNRLVLRATNGLNTAMIGSHSLAVGEGITGWTARHGKPVTVADAWQDERFRYVPSLQEEQFHGWLSVPIILFRTGEAAAADANKLVGVLGLMTRAIKEFTAEEVAFVEAVAGQVAIAIENARLYGLTDNRLREKVEQLEALQRVNATIASSLDIDDVLQQMARQAAHITATDMAGIFVLDERSNVMRMAASYNMTDAYQAIAVPVGEGAIGLAVAQRKPVVVSDAQEDPRLQAKSVARWVVEEGYRSMFSVPVTSRGRVLGGVSVYTRERREFTSDQIHMLSAFADDAAIAIDNARLYEETRKALEMKSVLLQELHHRVKNNLQMMASLLRMQMRRTTSDAARSTLAVTYSQIESLSAAHDLLSQDTGASGTQMGRATVGEIARRVADIAIADLLPRDKRVTFCASEANADVGARRATLLALILNEVFCNSIEHGFASRDVGQVTVTAQRLINPNGTGTIEVIVQDDGDGLPAGFDPHRDAGLGLTIMQRLVIDQLRGQLRVENRTDGISGTRAYLCLPD